MRLDNLSAEAPRCDWVYFATSSKHWNAKQTGDFVADQGLIVRSIHNSAGIRIPHVSALKVGERIMLTYGGKGEPNRALCAVRIAQSAEPVAAPRQKFECFRLLEDRFRDELLAAGYKPDSVLGRHTGITVSEFDYIWHLKLDVPRPGGNNTLHRWSAVFSG